MNKSTTRIEHNIEGYIDTAADPLIKKEYYHKRNEHARKIENGKYQKMVRKIKKILSDNDYVLNGPINLINTNSGRRRRIY